MCGKLNLFVLVIVLTLSGPVACAQQGDNQTLAITGATLIDGKGGTPLSDAVVVIRGDRIVEVGSAKQIRVPRGARTIDAKGKWLIPGLIDAHVHFFQSGGLYTRPDVIDLRSRVPYEEELATIRKRLDYTFSRYLCSGVTATVDVGGPFWNFEVRKIAERSHLAPRVAVAGPLISTYAPENLKTDDPAIIKVDNIDEALALVRKELKHQPDLIKIWFIRRPDVDLAEATKMVKAVVDESHAAGVRVAVHATQLETAKAAVLAGCDILVHSVTDRPVDDEFAQLVKDRGVVYTTTLVVFEGYAEVLSQQVELTDFERQCGDPEVIDSWGDLAKIPADQLPAAARRPRSFANQEIVLQNLKRLQDVGAIVAAGTDAGNIGTLHGPALHREFELMAEAGLTPMQTLVAATRNAALVFGGPPGQKVNGRPTVAPEVGTIEAGKLADLVILNADPTTDIRNARRINSVIKGGSVVFESDKQP